MTIYPNIQLWRNTVTGEDRRIGPGSILIDVSVGDGVEVCRIHAILAEIGDRTNIGSSTYLWPGTRSEPEIKADGFCETKNIEVGRGTKISHLSHVGDAAIGEATSIGATTVSASYDGVSKHHSTVGLCYRTGMDNVFVALVHIDDGVYTGRGTVVRHDTPAGALAIDQFDMRIIPDWMVKHRPDTDAARVVTGKTGTAGVNSPEVESTAESLAPGSNSGDK